MMHDSPWKSTQHENDGLTKYGGRDMMGYGDHPPTPKWPKGGKVALNFVINYEEGAEKCLLHGDKESEHLLSDFIGAKPLEGERNLNIESMYDYGGKAGFWRLDRLFTKKKVPCTVFVCGMALERNPAICHALKGKDTWEIASHGYRWIDYQNVDEETERQHIHRTVEIHERLLGKRPVGLYQGKPSINTRKLANEEGLRFKYDSDDYSDDLPFWCVDYGDPHLIIPYTLSENDMRFTSASNFQSGVEFAKYLKENLRYMVEEARAGHPRMMTVGLHCRLARPGRVAGLSEFIDYAKSWGKEVWICTREEICDYWYDNHYPVGLGSPVEKTHERSKSLDSGEINVTEEEEKVDGGDVI